MNWYLKVVKGNYANFRGRARRQEYWMFAFINLMFAVLLSMIDRLVFDAGNFILSSLYMLIVLIPGIAVAVRRLHDTSRSGWWMLLAFIPVIGVVALIMMMCVDSTPAPNRYGPNPKGIGNQMQSLHA